jgi:hypothetical protein
MTSRLRAIKDTIAMPSYKEQEARANPKRHNALPAEQ